jgi:hypothetical protein
MRLLFLIPVFILVACNSHTNSSNNNYQKKLSVADSIANIAQKTLIQNVSNAISKGGTDYALTFCNEKAIALTDSLSVSNNVHIYRLSNKNRNPNNAINSTTDSLAWVKMATNKSGFIETNNKNESFFYKPIVIAMPTCLQCHGKENEISKSTLKLISEKYPNDKAINYSTGELRGMWKIKI